MLSVTEERDLMEQAFRDVCDELGCAYDNEAALIAAHELKQRAVDWRDIETAHFEMVSPSGRPEDADPWLDWCLLWVPDEYGGLAVVGGMDAGVWLYRDPDRACGGIERKPTHWAPLPRPPA